MDTVRAHRIGRLLTVSSLAWASSACLDKTPLDPGLYQHSDIVEDTVVLNDRVKYIDDVEIEVLPTISLTDASDGTGHGSAAAAAKPFQLILQAEVRPPVVGGVGLQATHLARNGDKAYVTYNVRGETYRGGVDVFDDIDKDKPKLTSQALFYDTEINAVAYDGGKLFLATATADEDFPNPAVLEIMKVKSGGKVLDLNSTRIPLASFAATGVKEDGGEIYVTSGSSGQLTVLDKNFNVIFADPLPDARAVDVDDYVVAMRGTPGSLRIYDKKTYARIRDIPIPGANIPLSKSSLVVKDNVALVAAGDGGTIAVDVETGVTLGSLPIPSVPGVPASKSVTNSVAYDDELVFMANGEAGIWVAEASEDPDKGKPFTLTMLGQLQLSGSANFVAQKGDRLFVAMGTGGLKIIRIEN